MKKSSKAWRKLIDFTKIKKGGIPIADILLRLLPRRNKIRKAQKRLNTR